MGYVKQEKHPLEYEYLQPEHLKGFDSYKVCEMRGMWEGND